MVMIADAIITGTSGLGLSIGVLGFEAILFVPVAILLAIGKLRSALVAAIPTFSISILLPIADAFYLRSIWLGYENADPSLADRYFSFDYLLSNHSLACISAGIILVCALISIVLLARQSHSGD